MLGLKMTKAFVREGALVVNFAGALQPFVWRIDISKVHVMGLRVQHSSPHWQLGIDNGKGEFAPVATFLSERAARRALKAIVAALKSQGADRRLLSYTGVVGVLVILFAIIIFLIVLMARVSGSMPSSMAAAGLPVAPQLQSGKVLSADDVLRLPQQ